MAGQLLVGESDSRGHPFPLPPSLQNEKMQLYPAWISYSFWKYLHLYGKRIFHILQRPLLWHNNHSDVLGCVSDTNIWQDDRDSAGTVMQLTWCVPCGFQVVPGDQWACRLHCLILPPSETDFLQALQSVELKCEYKASLEHAEADSCLHSVFR